MPVKRRSDAVQRRWALLAAAAEIFAEQGMSAPLDAIAERAGVGQATFYRNFPERGALLIALLDVELKRVAQIVSHTDPREVPQRVLHTIADALVASPTLSEFWKTTTSRSKEARAARARFSKLVRPGVRAAVRAGTVRRDLVANDIPLLGSMLGAILCGRDERERASLRRRVVDLLVDGLRPRKGR